MNVQRHEHQNAKKGNYSHVIMQMTPKKKKVKALRGDKMQCMIL